MNDKDADEIVRQRRGGNRMSLSDQAVVGTGLALAGLAFFFPWYAFFHQETFSLPSLWQGSTRDLPEKIGTPGLASAPQAAPSDAARTIAAQTDAALDRLTTATVPAPADRAADAERADQPFPGSNNFKLVHVAGGRALIEDASGMYVVRVGSPLPDNSRLATLEERDGTWVMITSNGDVYRAE